MNTQAPGLRPDTSQPLFWTVDDVLSQTACDDLIARAETIGFADAPITTSTGFVMRSDIRNNTRVMFDDADLAADLFGRIREHVPRRMNGGMEVSGLNERFRCYRYGPGQRFNSHYDGAYVRSPSERSLLTFMIYLNNSFAGGATRFFDPLESIAPCTGRALFFQHRLLHEGATVESGVKYVLRSDVMYRLPTP